MEITRQKELVEGFHYDANRPENDVQTEIKVELNPINMEDQADFPADSSVLGLRVIFLIAFDEFTLTGAVRQLVTVTGRKITTNQDLTQEETDELMRPLFSIIERLAYEVTEIALDRPGLQLNFSQND